MLAVIKLLLLLTATVRLSAAQGEGGCSLAPFWLFADPDDVRSIFQSITSAIVLVDDGVPLEALTNREFATIVLFVFEEVDEIPVIWCIQSTELQSIQYSILLESDEPNIMEVGVSVPDTGNITNIPYRLRLLFRCNPSGSRPTIGITLSMNLTSSSTGEQFCPVQFFFAKRCPPEGSDRGSGEGPTGLELLGITDGFVSNSNFSVKSTPPSVTRIVTLAPESTASKVLKGVFIPLGIISFTVLGILIFLGFRRYRKSKAAIAEFNPEAVNIAYRDLYAGGFADRGKHEKEFPPERLRIVRELGEGAFGVVSQAEAEGIVDGEKRTDVAVKQLRDESQDFDEFFREVDFMSGLDHPNIVRLLGVCSQREPFSMIFEYMDLGDLRSFLREAIGLGKNVEDEAEPDEEAPEEPLLTSEELLTIALQVAGGMVYISGQNLVHRDLAARNCLVATGLVVKIGDFGMSRNMDTTDYYRVKGSAILPIRWMPPESLMYGKFTVESDIWAFGILLWELFTFGQQPYFGMGDEEVISSIKEGQHPEPPPECPAHSLMLQCWSKSPKKRPNFEECRKQIQQLIDTASS